MTGIITRLIGLANRRGVERRGLLPAIACQLLEWIYKPSRNLAVYGSLAPGRANHHELAFLDGHWARGTVYGRLEDSGWGAAMGYPAMRWDPDGRPVPVWVLSSPALPGQWSRLDAFEGDQYLRCLVPVYRDKDLVFIANCYLARG